jgi:REP element-mobilizing transposase RayT
LTYLLTFDCYGMWLPGDQRGWIDRIRGEHRGGYREPSPALEAHAQELMLHDPYLLDRPRAQSVLAAILEVCEYRDWELLAAHVRTNHVHCVVDSVMPPSQAIGDFKAYASRALNKIEGQQKRWARGGAASTLITNQAIYAAIHYVAECQGDAMAVHVCDRDPKDV